MRQLVLILLIGTACAKTPSSTITVDGGFPRDDSTFQDAVPQRDVDSGETSSWDADILDAGFAPFEVPECLEPSRSLSEEESKIQDPRGIVRVQSTGLACSRSYALASTQAQRDPARSQNRTVQEMEQFPVLRSGNPMFDALYALSISEMKENSVSEIKDGAFNNGQPIACPKGGCFETGRLWHYVWTRDIAYATDLALASLDPIRAKNSLDFKLSQRRNGTDLQIVQDTGTGGGYPVSTDRVAWALGAFKALHFLNDSDRVDFSMRIRDALNNTLAQDREVVFDQLDGLYKGESSFLDWREQTYPNWVREDVVHVAMSKSLSTNLLHLRAIEIAVSLNTRAGDTALASMQEAWADALRDAINLRFTIAGEDLYSAFLPTQLDQAASRRFDLLASALAILMELPDEQASRAMVSSYPHTIHGPPVVWPQQSGVPIYHNRAIWPFVTAYWLKAAQKIGHATAVNHNVASLLNAAALNLSNMENLEFTEGLPWVDDGSLSGPVVNSERQLWSVAGYLSMVQDVLFGMETNLDGIRFAPKLTGQIHQRLFSGVDRLVLNRFIFRSKELHVSIELPDEAVLGSVYELESVTLNGADFGLGFFHIDDLESRNLVTIRLRATVTSSSSPIKLLNNPQPEDVFPPQTPQIDEISVNGSNLRIQFSAPDEAPVQRRFNLYRDDQLLAEGLAGNTTQYTDETNLGESSPSHCYAIETEFVDSGLVSQRSRPRCFWGSRGQRVTSIYAGDFTNQGGTLVDEHGWLHYQNWGEPSHALRVSGFVAPVTGSYLVQVFFANGLGGLTTGITCSFKRLTVYETGRTNTHASGYLTMPHTGDWTQWRDSSFVQVELRAGQSYDFVIDQNNYAQNMSSFSHFSTYTGGNGGTQSTNFVNIAEIRILSLSAL